MPGTTFQRYTASFREPYLFDSMFGFTNSMYYFNRGYAEYTEDRYGDRITIDRRLDPYWSVSGSTRIEGVNVRNVPVYASQAIAGTPGSTSCSGCGPG